MRGQESAIQKQLFSWFKYQYPDKLWNSDLGGVWTKNIRQAMKNKAIGHSNGFPDIFIPEPDPVGQYHGLFIELKATKKGVLSDSQEQWLRNLNDRNYYAVVCYGYEEAKDIITNYLKGNPKNGKI